MGQKNTWHFLLNKNLVFIDSMQFMNSSVNKLAKNLSDKGFGSNNLELLKQKGAYPYEYIDSFERFNEEKVPAKKYFYSSTKDGKIGDDGKISDGHISAKNYLTCKKTWDKFEMKNMIIIYKKTYYYQLMFLKSLLICV